MLTLAIGMDLCQTLSRWPQPDGWTGVGFGATVLGSAVGAVSLVLTVLIYRWTKKDDSERHEQLMDALREKGAALKQAYEVSPAPDEAELVELSPEEQASLRALLVPGESIIRVARSRSGKGNHPWLATTTAGRSLQVYTGGRLGRVYAKVLD